MVMMSPGHSALGGGRPWVVCIDDGAGLPSTTDSSATMPANADLMLDPPVEREMAGRVKPLVSDVCRYPSHPDRQQHEKFIQEAVRLMLDKAVFSLDRQTPVLKWTDPDKLLDTMDFQLSTQPSTHDKLLELLNDTIQHSVKTGHPYFMNQLFSAVDPYGLVGQWLTDALNPSVYTYEVSPVFTLMEETVLAEMRKFVGWSQGDGIFCPGGSMANGYAISCARYHAVPQVKSKGLHGLPRMVVFTSEDAHYSIKKLATLQGLGADNVYLVKTDNLGRMDVADLKLQVQRAIDEGAKPFMVSATAGTTVLGAFDPLPAIADVCEAHHLWFHVDAAWGGGALVSRRHRHLLTGIHRADSVTWNPHKLLTAPQQCSTFLTRHTDLLGPCHSASATYLFQKDKFYDTKYDTGDKHIQCGRRADVLKFWFMWKAKGTDGLESHIDTVFGNAQYFTEQIRHRPGFKLVLDKPECTNVSFWYIPPSLRGQESSPDFNQRLHKVAPLIKERMMREGTMMITYQPLHDLPNFFRLVMQNSSLEHADMNFVINEIERLGENL